MKLLRPLGLALLCCSIAMAVANGNQKRGTPSPSSSFHDGDGEDPIVFMSTSSSSFEVKNMTKNTSKNLTKEGGSAICDVATNFLRQKVAGCKITAFANQSTGITNLPPLPYLSAQWPYPKLQSFDFPDYANPPSRLLGTI